MTTTDIASKLQNWLVRLERAKDKTIMLERRLETENGKIAKLEAKIKKFSVYKSYYEREGK